MGLILIIWCGFVGIASLAITGFIGVFGFHMFKRSEPNWLIWLIYVALIALITSAILFILFNLSFPAVGGGNDYGIMFRVWSTKTAIAIGAPGTAAFLAGFVIYLATISRREKAEVLTRRGYRR
ncbi:hypothetical protein [Aurantivibrio plasticivorans]